MKKRVSLLFICMLILGCSSKAPGSQETGFEGLPWGADAAAVARRFHVASTPTPTDSLFGGYYKASAPRVAELLKQGLSKLLTGKSTGDVDHTDAVRHMSMLDQGKNGYSVFFNGKFGMNVDIIQTRNFQEDHDALMKKYGVIDKKTDFIANEYESSYFIQWHNADGVILLAREIRRGPAHKLITTAQIIHMDRKVFDAMSKDLLKAGT